MRLTEKDDMTKSQNVDKVFKAIQKYGSEEAQEYYDHIECHCTGHTAHMSR